MTELTMWTPDFMTQPSPMTDLSSISARVAMSEPFAFSTALHTYHLVDQVGEVRIDGLQDGPLAIGDTLDEIFHGVKGSIALRTGSGTLELEQAGFTDAVVWNPGAANAAAMPDLGDDEYRRFVCI